MALIRKTAVVIIMTAVAFSFMPVLGSPALAAAKTPSKPKITSAAVKKNTITVKWTKAKYAKAYQVRLQYARKTWKKTKTVRKSAANKKKYTVKNKLKVVAKGNKYIVYKRASVNETIDEITVKKRTYKATALKYNTKYRISVRAVNDKKKSKWTTVKKKTPLTPYENYSKFKVTDVTDARAKDFYNRLQNRKAFVVIIKAGSQKAAEKKFDSLKKKAAKYDSLRVTAGYVRAEWDDWFHRGQYYYLPVKNSDINKYFWVRKYIQLAYDDRNQYWAELANMFDDPDRYNSTLQDYRDYFRCEMGTTYRNLSTESRLIHAMPRDRSSDTKDFMYYPEGNGPRTNIDYSITTADTYRLLCEKKAYGKCMEYAYVCVDICNHLGIKAYYCADSNLNHAWAAAKLKDSSGKTKLFLMDNGRPRIYESKSEFKNSDRYKGTKWGMGNAFPY